MSLGGTTAFRSILDKPLNQLTEDDISQLTREDCRKYLKEKGMRRPSWNKSQAIQQVISLKALLEPSEDSGVGALRKIIASPSPNNQNPPRVAAISVTSNSADSAKEASAELQISVSAEDSGPCPGKEHIKSVAETEDRHIANVDERSSPKNLCGTDGMFGQMTIFYCGKVNVYEAVPPEKARAIMHLAAGPSPISGPVMPKCFSWNLHAPNDKAGLYSPSTATVQPMQIEKISDYGQHGCEKESEADGQASRKASLERYLEKRRDRGRLKTKKIPGFNSSSFDVYMNRHHHEKSHHTPNGNSSRSSTGSPTQPGLPQALCSTMENHPKIDLNEKRNSSILDGKYAFPS